MLKAYYICNKHRIFAYWGSAGVDDHNFVLAILFYRLVDLPMIPQFPVVTHGGRFVNENAVSTIGEYLLRFVQRWIDVLLCPWNGKISNYRYIFFRKTFSCILIHRIIICDKQGRLYRKDGRSHRAVKLPIIQEIRVLCQIAIVRRVRDGIVPAIPFVISAVVPHALVWNVSRRVVMFAICTAHNIAGKRLHCSQCRNRKNGNGKEDTPSDGMAAKCLD